MLPAPGAASLRGYSGVAMPPQQQQPQQWRRFVGLQLMAAPAVRHAAMRCLRQGVLLASVWR